MIGDDGVLVIDTFQDPRPAKALLGEIRKLTPLPIRFVVNTHYHLDHVNGNDVFAAAGATIVAHRNVRAWMRTENIKMLDPPVTPEKKARVASLTLPTVVHDSHLDLFLGARRINVRYYPGHTGGDSVVSIPDAHVVFCGDMLWKEHVPNLIDASTRPLGRIAGCDAEGLRAVHLGARTRRSRERSGCFDLPKISGRLARRSAPRAGCREVGRRVGAGAAAGSELELRQMGLFQATTPPTISNKPRKNCRGRNGCRLILGDSGRAPGPSPDREKWSDARCGPATRDA